MSEAARPTDYDDVNLGTITGTFYRYRRFDDPKNAEKHRHEERQRIKRMLAERVVWYAKPSTLNHPFDCRPVLVWSGNMSTNRKQMEKVWKEVYERHHGCKPKDRNEISRHVTQVMQCLKSQQKRNDLYLEALDKGTGVLCLSKDWRITQQWTYYAREHTGFCIEFNIQEVHQISAYRIDYRTKRPEVNMIRLLEDDDYLNRVHYPALLVKAAAWKHEAEVRILANRYGDTVLPEGIFRSITFGMAASEEDIHWAQTICDEAGLDISFYQCVLDDKTFTLQRRPLNHTKK